MRLLVHSCMLHKDVCASYVHNDMLRFGNVLSIHPHCLHQQMHVNDSPGYCVLRRRYARTRSRLTSLYKTISSGRDLWLHMHDSLVVLSLCGIVYFYFLSFLLLFAFHFFGLRVSKWNWVRYNIGFAKWFRLQSDFETWIGIVFVLCSINVSSRNIRHKRFIVLFFFFFFRWVLLSFSLFIDTLFKFIWWKENGENKRCVLMISLFLNHRKETKPRNRRTFLLIEVEIIIRNRATKGTNKIGGTNFVGCWTKRFDFIYAFGQKYIHRIGTEKKEKRYLSQTKMSHQTIRRQCRRRKWKWKRSLATYKLTQNIEQYTTFFYEYHLNA